MEVDSFTTELGWLATVRQNDQEDGVTASEVFVGVNSKTTMRAQGDTVLHRR